MVLSDYRKMDRVLEEERNYIRNMVQKIHKTGCNVVLIQKSIMRDALNDLSLQYLARLKIMVVKDIERSDIEFISNALGLSPIASIDSFTKEKLGSADLAEEVATSDGSHIIKVTGISQGTKTVSIFCRASNKLVLAEVERCIHDALCVVRSLVKKRFIIPGGGAPEIEMALQLSKWSKTLPGMESYCVRAYADALEILPYTLAENAGLSPIAIVTELRNRHAEGDVYAGIDIKKVCPLSLSFLSSFFLFPPSLFFCVGQRGKEWVVFCVWKWGRVCGKWEGAPLLLARSNKMPVVYSVMIGAIFNAMPPKQNLSYHFPLV